MLLSGDGRGRRMVIVRQPNSAVQACSSYRLPHHCLNPKGKKTLTASSGSTTLNRRGSGGGGTNPKYKRADNSLTSSSSS
jgi:hypothetical protein